LVFQEEIKANLERAEESLKAAKLLLDSGHHDFSASRAYYSAFYGATAALLSKGLRFGKHSSVITAIHQYFVKPGIIDQDFGRMANLLFELRSIGDYGETEHLPKEEAQKSVILAEKFIEKMKEVCSLTPENPVKK